MEGACLQFIGSYRLREAHYHLEQAGVWLPFARMMVRTRFHCQAVFGANSVVMERMRNRRHRVARKACAHAAMALALLGLACPPPGGEDGGGEEGG